MTACPDCLGTGGVRNVQCLNCSGSGIDPPYPPLEAYRSEREMIMNYEEIEALEVLDREENGLALVVRLPGRAEVFRVSEEARESFHGQIQAALGGPRGEGGS